MRSSGEAAIIVGVAAMLGLGTWIVGGRPTGDPVAALESRPLKEGEIRFVDLGDLEGVVWVDARRVGEWQTDGLPGSIHLSTLSERDLSEQLVEHQELLFSSDRLVIYCGDADCGLSHELAERLREDYADLIGGEILVLQGGLTALRQAGKLRDSSRD